MAVISAFIGLLLASKQWGVSTKDTTTYMINVIYAKQFELFCRPIAIPYLANTSIDSSARLAISSVTNSEFIFMTDTSSITTQAIWFVAGVQQWGYITESSSSTDYRYFPVPFATDYYAICTGSSQRQDNVSVWLNQIDTLKFLAGIGENYAAMPQKNIFYFACGRQQWGIVENIKPETQVTSAFPTVFSSSNFAVLPVIFAWETIDDTISAYCISKNLSEAIFLADTGRDYTSTNYANILYTAIGQ